MPVDWIGTIGAWTVLAAAAVVDTRQGRIPNRLTGGAALAGLALRLASGNPGETPEAAAAGLAAASALLGIRWLGLALLRTPGMGMGDVKLAGALGLWLGWRVLWIVYLAAVLGAVAGAAGLLSGRLERRIRVPFAPLLALGAAVEAVVLPFEAALAFLAP